MLGYYFFLAWKNIRRTPGNSLIVVVGIALGVAVSTLFSTIYYTYARDPIPEKSGSLYHVRMDSWDPKVAHPMGIPPRLTYQDTLGILESNIPVRQTGSYPSTVLIGSHNEPNRARRESVRLCNSDFFAMFDVPFRYGSAWTTAMDDPDENVAVIDDTLNQRLFGGRNSVGEVVTIEGRPFRVVGVIEPWQPSIRYYDALLLPTALVERVYVPLRRGSALRLSPETYSLRWKQDPKEGTEGAYMGELVFIDVWVELHGADHIAAYKRFLDGYAADQRRTEHFSRPIDNRLTPLLEYMRECKCPPPEAAAMMLVADLVLLACALSLIGLLWARFLARSAESSVRRALGASRWDIFAQHIIECQVVALGGGIVGLGLAVVLLQAINMHYMAVHTYEIFHVNGAMIACALIATSTAGLVAGVYPAYRACRIAPAWHLKLQ